MPGRPKTRAAFALIEKSGGEHLILNRVAEGTTLKQLAEELGISRPMLSAWCNHPTRQDAYTRARRAAADAYMDEGLEILDKAQPEDVHVARARSDFRKYLAARLNPSAWSEKPSTELTIDLGALHLAAVKAVSANRKLESEGLVSERENLGVSTHQLD
jgi:transcriptional regulator with XRE-family HTH domain